MTEQTIETDHLHDGAVTACKLASESVNHHHLAAHLQNKLASFQERIDALEAKVARLEAGEEYDRATE